VLATYRHRESFGGTRRDAGSGHRCLAALAMPPNVGVATAHALGEAPSQLVTLVSQVGREIVG